MKHITEHVINGQTYLDINEFLAEQLDEGLKDKAKDALNNVKELIGKVFKYLKGKISEINGYFLSISDDENEILPVVNSLMGQQAWLNGEIPDSKGMMWMGNKETRKFVKNSTKPEDIVKSRGSSLDLYKKASHMTTESLLENAQKVFEQNKHLKTIFEGLSDEEKALLENELSHEDKDILEVDGNRLKFLIKNSITNKNARPLLIYGAPGVGKTQVVKAVARELGYDLDYEMLDWQLSQKNRDDFFLPGYNEGKTKAVDIPKSYLPVYKRTRDVELNKKLSEQCGKGIIFMDELSQASSAVQAVMLKLVGERILGEEYSLGDDWRIIAASNRDQDIVQGNEFNEALLDRFFSVNYAPSMLSWKEWAQTKKYMNQHVLDWLELHQQYFYHRVEGSSKLCTPRDWEWACKTLCEYAHTAEEEGFKLEQIPDDLIEVAIAGNCGNEAAHLFMEYVQLLRVVNVEDLKKVWTDPMKAPLPDTKRMDQVYIYSSYIVSLIDKMPTTEQFNNIMKYAVRLNSESGASRLMYGLVNKFPDMNACFGKTQQLSKYDTYEQGVYILMDGYPEWQNCEEIFAAAKK